MGKNKEQILALYRRYLANQCSPEEIDWLLSNFDPEANSIDEEPLLRAVQEEFFRPAEEEEPSIAETMKLIQLQGNIKKRISQKEGPVRRTAGYISRVKGFAILIILPMLAIVGGYIWYRSLPRRPVISMEGNLPKEIVAGHQGATLHLCDGRTIVLDSTSDGTLAMQGKVQLIKDKNGIRYTGTSQEPLYNTIETGPGREYHFTLPDGSVVWLNAASSIIYPISFKGTNRTVTVTGEAYFQVVHNAEKPFVVKVGKQMIEDIGTAFNVNAYPDEADIRTTLIEGAARIISGSQSAILKPGEQARVKGDVEIIAHADIETVLGWKNGTFQFHNTDLREVMRQVGRWYNVTIEYKGNMEPQLFTGTVPRNMPVSKVLTILEELGVKFTIKQVPENDEKGIITVTP